MGGFQLASRVRLHHRRSASLIGSFVNKKGVIKFAREFLVNFMDEYRFPMRTHAASSAAVPTFVGSAGWWGWPLVPRLLCHPPSMLHPLRVRPGPPGLCPLASTWLGGPPLLRG